jgi:hypothetical protein
MLVAPPTAFEDVDGNEGSRIGVGGNDLEVRSCGNTEELLKKFCYPGDRMIGRTTAVAWEGRRYD